MGGDDEGVLERSVLVRLNVNRRRCTQKRCSQSAFAGDACIAGLFERFDFSLELVGALNWGSQAHGHHDVHLRARGLRPKI